MTGQDYGKIDFTRLMDIVYESYEFQKESNSPPVFWCRRDGALCFFSYNATPDVIIRMAKKLKEEMSREKSKKDRDEQEQSKDEGA